MTVVRRRHNGNFVTVPNRVLDDKRLSLEAKGLLCWLLARPNDWTFKLALIGPFLNVGRDKTERLFRVLIDAGYVDRIQDRTGGRWGPVEYCVFDEPQSFARPIPRSAQVDTVAHQDTVGPPLPEKPVPAKPVPVNQGALIKQKDTKAADDARAREPSKSSISPEAYGLCDDLMRLQQLEKADPRCIGMAYGVQAWLSKGWNADVIRQAVEAVMARCSKAPRSIKYFEGAIAEAHAERDRPLPVAQPSNNINVKTHGTPQKQSGVVAAARRLAEQFERQSSDGIEGNTASLLRLPAG
jgi:hypothetical protein